MQIIKSLDDRSDDFRNFPVVVFRIEYVNIKAGFKILQVGNNAEAGRCFIGIFDNKQDLFHCFFSESCSGLKKINLSEDFHLYIFRVAGHPNAPFYDDMSLLAFVAALFSYLTKRAKSIIKKFTVLFSVK